MSDDQAELAAARARVTELEARERAKAAAAGPTVVGPSGGGGGLSNRSLAWLIGGAALIGALVMGQQLLSRPPALAPPDPNPNWKAEAEAVKPIGDDGGAVMAAASPWRYGVLPDAIRGQAGATACVSSNDQVRLDFPYETQNTELCIRRSPRHGLDVYLTLPEGGQYVCRSYEGCTVQVRFDDGKAASYPAVGAADGSSDIIFIRRAETFLARIRASKVTRIEATYYRAGSQVSTFSTRDLDVEQLALRSAG